MQNKIVNKDIRNFFFPSNFFRWMWAKPKNKGIKKKIKIWFLVTIKCWTNEIKDKMLIKISLKSKLTKKSFFILEFLKLSNKKINKEK